jgi:hypothetical protein
MNNACFFFILPILVYAVQLVFIPILVELASRVVANRMPTLLISRIMIARCRLVTYVTVVVRKVGYLYQCSFILLISSQGHWIQDCPTNSDREFDNRPRIKRTTGIPRSMLKAVENPNSAELGQGVMVTPEGGYVVAQPDL